MKNKKRTGHKKTTENQKVKKTVKGKKPVFIGVVLIIVIIIFAQLLYWYVIPRVNVDLKTVYHEATGGAGTGGSINVNSKYINIGTESLNNFKITLSIRDSTRSLLATKTHEESLISPGAEHELKLVTNGNCYEKFYIELEVKFRAADSDYYEKYSYETYEDAMNIGFEDSIFDWGF